MALPRIAVVIPCRNDARFLNICLEALARQIRQPDLIIVVDNDSDDDSARIGKARGAKVIHHEQVGIWPAASRGYDAALIEGADIIARIDADSVPWPHWLQHIEQVFLADPELLVYTGMGEMYGIGPIRRWMSRNLYLGLMKTIVEPYLGNACVYGSNFAMRRLVWEQKRDVVARDRADIHDDLDLAIRMRPGDKMVFDRSFSIPVSGRPLKTWSSFGQAVSRAFRTLVISWPEGAPFYRRRAARNQRHGRM